MPTMSTINMQATARHQHSKLAQAHIFVMSAASAGSGPVFVPPTGPPDPATASPPVHTEIQELREALRAQAASASQFQGAIQGIYQTLNRLAQGMSTPKEPFTADTP